MSADDAQTRRAVEQAKLDRWCAAHHIEAASDLAFCVPLLMAGNRPAAKSRLGLELWFRCGQVSQAAPRPTISPTLTSRPAPSFSGPVRPSARGHQSGGSEGGAISFLPQLMAILLAIEPPPADRFVEFTANFEARLKGILQQADAATVKRALHTWQELQVVLTSSGDTRPDKHLLATFFRQHAAPARAFTSLGWLVRNLRLPFDMTEVTKPRSGLGAGLGQGQAQAATLEPSMVLHLLGTLELTIADPQWPLIFCTYAMCFGVVRFTHLQRSYLVGGNGGILVFWCTKGKTGSRGGFAWSVPRYCGTLDLFQVFKTTSTRSDLIQDLPFADGIGLGSTLRRGVTVADSAWRLQSLSITWCRSDHRWPVLAARGSSHTVLVTTTKGLRLVSLESQARRPHRCGCQP